MCGCRNLTEKARAAGGHDQTRVRGRVPLGPKRNRPSKRGPDDNGLLVAAVMTRVSGAQNSGNHSGIAKRVLRKDKGHHIKTKAFYSGRYGSETELSRCIDGSGKRIQK